MERLTKRVENNKIHSYEPTEYGNDRDRTDLLGEYEDLGMTPHEIRTFLGDFGVTIIIRRGLS